ncbi:MAG: RtcB family protein [Phycisphaerales bacterium]
MSQSTRRSEVATDIAVDTAAAATAAAAEAAASTPRDTAAPAVIASDSASPFVPTGPASAILPRPDNGVPVKVFGTPAIRGGLDAGCLRQALNCAMAPGISQVVLNPDAHVGYGAPIGCVMSSPSHIYPGPIGVDIKCSMSLLALDLDEDAIADPRVRRELIKAICRRTPTGTGRQRRKVEPGRTVGPELGRQAVTEGASAGVCAALGVPEAWAERCEDAQHFAADGSVDGLRERLDVLMQDKRFAERFPGKIRQFGTYGGGNHFGECEVVRVHDSDRARTLADAFGLREGGVAFLSHCGSRGLGNDLATGQFRALKAHFDRWGIPLPGGDRHMVHAPLGSPEADAYIADMSIGANFATVNHMVINALVLEAFQEVLPGTTGELVYLISHNIARPEIVGGRLEWVHRKGATRAFPAGHPGLRGTPFADTGHPILLPGDPQAGSAVMVADAGAVESCYSVNHGAGRTMSRTAAKKALDQQAVDASFAAKDILTNSRQYPLDEAPAAYKDFEEVLRSVKEAGLASEVARLDARFVIKDGDKADD